MYPADATLTDSLSYAGRTVRRGNLALGAGSGGNAQLSPVLAGSSSLLTAKLVSKMNVLRGLDTSFYIGHHTGGHLGNYARNDGNGSDGVTMQSYSTPTIDQLMAWSPSFYGSLSSNLMRTMVIGSRISYNWSNPQSRSGAIQEIAGTTDALALFNKIFVARRGRPRPIRTRPCGRSSIACSPTTSGCATRTRGCRRTIARAWTITCSASASCSDGCNAPRRRAVRQRP